MIQVRKSTMEDLQALAELYDKAVLHLTQTVNYPKWQYGVYPCRDSVEKAIRQGVQYQCADGGKVVGGLILNEDPQGAYERGEWQHDLNTGEFLVIHTLATDPDAFGKGVATQMVRYCIDHAKKAGYQALRVDVVPENFPARRLYEKLGFTFAGEKDLLRNIKEIPTFLLYELNF